MIKFRFRPANVLCLFLLAISAAALLTRVSFYAFSSISVYVSTLICALFLWLKGGYSWKQMVFFGIFTIVLLLSLWFNHGGAGSVLTYICSLLLLSVLPETDMDHSMRKWISWICLFLILYIFLRSFTYIRMADFRRNNLVGLNSNTLGMFTLFAFMLYTCINYEEKKNWFWWALLALSLVSSVLLRSRGTMVSLIGFVFLFLLPQKWLSGKCLFWMCILLIVAGTVFPFVLVFLYKSGIDFRFLGKSLFTGRQDIWINMFDAMSSIPDWIFGIGSKAELWVGHDLNVHNDYFATIVNFGLAGYALFEGYVIMMITRACRKNQISEQARVWMIMFIAGILLLGFTETTTHWAVIFIYAWLPLAQAVKETQSPNAKCTETDGSLSHRKGESE